MNIFQIIKINKQNNQFIATKKFIKVAQAITIF